MNRTHLWKLLLILFIVGWALTAMWPPKGRPLIEVFQENIGKLRELLFRVVAALPEERDCPCATALATARFEVS